MLGSLFFWIISEGSAKPTDVVHVIPLALQ